MDEVMFNVSPFRRTGTSPAGMDGGRLSPSVLHTWRINIRKRLVLESSYTCWQPWQDVVLRWTLNFMP